MATIPGAMLLCASSPHARKGAFWTAYRKHHGVDGDPVLVWRAPTREMNPTVPQSFIDAHMADDPARAAAEYLAEFRSDLEAFVQREVIENCTGGFIELAPAANTRYFGFVDAAGGGGRRFRTVPSSRSWCRCCGAIASAGLSVTAGRAVSRLSSSSNTTSSTKPASRSKATCMSICCRC